MALKKVNYIDEETVIEAENLNDIQDSIIALEDGVVACTASGNVLSITDSSFNKLLGLSIYGKSTQAGTPTPDAPVDIVSVGDDGYVSISIYGKNILKNNAVSETKHNVTFTVNSDKSITVNGTSTGYADCYLFGSNADAGEYVFFPKGSKILGHTVNNTMLIMRDKTLGPVYGYAAIQEVLNKQDIYAYGFCVRVEPGLTVSNVTVYPMISLSAGAYVPYIGQETSVTTTSGLWAIPVTTKALATYTDSNGQMWCADEIDFERGVFVQRIKTKRVMANATWYYSDATMRFYALDDDFEKIGATTPVRAMCTHFRANTDSTIEDLEMTFVNDTTSGYAYRYDTLNGDLNAWKTFLTENEVFISGVLATPIETPLTAEEIAAYKALHTNKPNTTIINDENAYMTVKYIADPKSYIDNKVASAIHAATVE